MKKPQKHEGRDTHLYLDDKMWALLERIAKADDRSVTAMLRVLVKEALQARESA